jgi:uroporphyrinogen-III synthase
VKLLVLRPEPGASATAARARAIGLEPVVVPLFEIVAIEPGRIEVASFDALLLTSANAARHAPAGFASLAVFAVGEATAEAARAQGFGDINTGPSDAAAALEEMARSGVKRALYLCGRDHIAVRHRALGVERRIVYAAEPLDPASGALEGPAVAMVHSARAARRFAGLVRDRATIALAAISATAAEAAGEGWKTKRVAAAPRDQALLELAAELCNTGWAEAEDGERGL